MHKLILSKKAFNFLKKIDKLEKERISKKLEELKKNPKSGVPLVANLSGLWKLRVGDFRVIYQIRENELLILVVKMGHRKMFMINLF